MKMLHMGANSVVSTPQLQLQGGWKVERITTNDCALSRKDRNQKSKTTGRHKWHMWWCEQQHQAARLYLQGQGRNMSSNNKMPNMVGNQLTHGDQEDRSCADQQQCGQKPSPTTIDFFTAAWSSLCLHLADQSVAAVV